MHLLARPARKQQDENECLAFSISYRVHFPLLHLATLYPFAFTARCEEHYECNHFHLVADTAIAALHAANNFFECAKPWELKPGGAAANAPRLETILAMTMDALRLCGIVLQPMMPQLASRLLDKLAVPQPQRSWAQLNESFAAGHHHHRHHHHQLDEHCSALLFQRIMEQQQQQQQPSPAKAKPNRSKAKREQKTAGS